MGTKTKARPTRGRAAKPTGRADPTRTTLLRRQLAAEIKRRFARLRMEVVDLVERQDAFGLGLVGITGNAFCPTGQGGGIDATCGGKSGGAAGAVKGAAVSAVKAAGKVSGAVGKAEHVAKQWTQDKVGAGIARLPKPARAIAKGVLKGLAFGGKALFANWTLGQHLVEKVARARGVRPADAKKLRGVLSSIDLKAFEVFKVSALAGVGAAATPAVVTGTVPIASTAYLAYSAARNPVLTAQGALGLVGYKGAHRPGAAKPGVEELPRRNVFCPTGEGGGVDPTCSPGGKGAGDGGAKLPKVGAEVSIGGSKYWAEPFDGDDTFPPAIASYEVREGHIFYTGRNGSEGVVTGTRAQSEKWMKEVRDEVQRRPLASALHRPWTPADGGAENVEAAKAMAARTAAAFGIKTPAIEVTVAERPLEAGEHTTSAVRLANSYKKTRNDNLNFKTDVSNEVHTAAHETSHAAYSANPERGREYQQKLKATGEYVSVYHALAGHFEGLMDLGAAYVHSPAALKSYSPKLFEVAEGWVTRSPGVEELPRRNALGGAGLEPAANAPGVGDEKAEAFVDSLAEAFSGHDFDDWFVALFLAAMDSGLKGPEALGRAEELIKENPEGPPGDDTDEAAAEMLPPATANAFCPTGPGGGVDPTCSPGGKGSKVWTSGGSAEDRGPLRIKDSGLVDAKAERKKIDRLMDETEEEGPDGKENLRYHALTHIASVLLQHDAIPEPKRQDWRFSYAVDGRGDVVGAASARFNRGSGVAIIGQVGSIAKGGGRKVVEDLIASVRSSYEKYGLRELRLTAPGTAVEFYKRLGFKDAGEAEEGRGARDLTLSANTFFPAPPTPTDNTLWDALDVPGRLAAFSDWFRGRSGQLLAGARGTWERFIAHAFRRGLSRAYDDAVPVLRVPLSQLPPAEGPPSPFAAPARTPGFSPMALPGITPREFYLRVALGRSTARDTVALLVQRFAGDLDGVTDQLEAALLRVLADGFGGSKTKEDVARQLGETVDSYKKRADALAQDAVVRSHADGQLEGLGQLGVTAVEPEVEWRTAGDKRVCPLCRKMAGVQFTLEEARGKIPAHVGCLTGDSLVLSRSGISAATKRYYNGDIVVFCTASGRELSCTPNHPILTDAGWVPAGRLHVGSNVVCDGGSEWEPCVNDYGEDAPALIHEVAEAFGRSCHVVASKVPTSAPDFHGDGMEGQVAVVWSDRLLAVRHQPPATEHLMQGGLVDRDVYGGRTQFPGSSRQALLGERLDPTGGCQVCGGGLLPALVGGHPGPLGGLGSALIPPFDSGQLQDPSHGSSGDSEPLGYGVFRLAGGVIGYDRFGRETGRPPDGDALFSEYPDDDVSTDAELAGKILGGAAGPVFLDDVVSVNVQREFSGHVYNLQTGEGFYSASGIITHNCRCAWKPLIRPPAPLPPPSVPGTRGFRPSASPLAGNRPSVNERLGGSFFARCARDSLGRCLPEGRAVSAAGQPIEVASPAEFAAARRLARAKAARTPVPSAAEAKAASRRMDLLGADRYESQIRGNSTDRASSRARLLKEFGDGAKCPCVYCGIKLDDSTVTRDKVHTARRGGRYRQDNLVPACLHCNKSRGDVPWQKIVWK